MEGEIVAVCTSPGGIPKVPVTRAEVVTAGLVGDGHAHAKHIQPHRAVLLQDLELLEEFRQEGFPVQPGSLGENLTVRGLRVQTLAEGTRLQIDDGGPLLELTEARRPCFVLDPIHPDMQKAAKGRSGMMARVIAHGYVTPGQRIRVVDAIDS